MNGRRFSVQVETVGAMLGAALSALLGASSLGCSRGQSPPAVATTETTSASSVHHEVTSATRIMKEGVADDGHRIPVEAAARATCVAVAPEAFRNGVMRPGQETKGVVTCRNAWGWSKPAFFVVKAGAAEHRVGSEGADLVILTYDKDAPTAFADEGEPVGTMLRCYAHGGGEFAGVEVGRVMLKADPASMRTYYGRDRRVKDVLAERVDVRAEPSTFPTAVTSSFNWAHAAFYPPETSASE